jgi:HlyD family secretion protein
VSAARILELQVAEGDWVKANQVIAILDNYAQSQAILEEAKRQVVTAQAKLAKVQAGAQDAEIRAQEAAIARLQAEIEGQVGAQEARIDRLEAELDNAIEQYERNQVLFAEGAIAESLLDSRRTDVQSFQEQVREAINVRDRIAAAGTEQIREAQANLERLSTVLPVDIAVAQAEVDSAIAAVQRAETELDLAYVRSPLAGQILDLHGQPGEVVDSQGVATLGRTDQMYVIAEVYETDIGLVQIGQPARILSEYGGFGGELQGVVEQIGLQIHRNSLYDPQPSAQADARVVEVQIRLNPSDSQQVATLTNLQVRVWIETNP